MAKLDAVLDELPDSGVLTPAMLAREYNPQSYADAFEAVQDYRRVQQRHAETGKKSNALASQLDLPRGRIRPWLNGSAPDPARAIAVGVEHGWFEDTDAITEAWAVLVVGTFAGGSIGTKWLRPYWTTEPVAAAKHIADALATLGCSTDTDLRDGRPDQVSATEHSSVVGRALVALGCGTGDTNPDTNPLPEWLLELSAKLRERACQTYVLYRGVAHDNKDTVTILAERSEAFWKSVIRLFDGVVTGQITAGPRGLTVSAEAARELGVARDGPLRSAIEPA